jgi:hypothetical protein
MPDAGIPEADSRAQGHPPGKLDPNAVVGAIEVAGDSDIDALLLESTFPGSRNRLGSSASCFVRGARDYLADQRAAVLAAPVTFLAQAGSTHRAGVIPNPARVITAIVYLSARSFRTATDACLSGMRLVGRSSSS